MTSCLAALALVGRSAWRIFANGKLSSGAMPRKMVFETQAAEAAYRPAVYRRILIGVVSLMLFVGASGAVKYVFDRIIAAQIDAELNIASQAFEAGEFRQAAASYAWLARRQPQVLAHRFHEAECVAAEGDPFAARQMMAALSPANEVGYLPALVWLARNHMLEATCDPDTFASLEAKLWRALHDTPHEPEPRDVLVAAYLQRQRVADAEHALGEEPRDAPDAAFRLARWYAVKGDRRRAHALAQHAVPAFRARALADHDVMARVKWAQAVSITGQIRDVVPILERGIEIHGPEHFAGELASLYVQYAELQRHSAGDGNRAEHFFAKALQVLEQYHPAQEDLLCHRALVGLGLHGEAEQRLIRATQRDVGAYLELIRFRMQRGDSAGARFAIEQGLAAVQRRLDDLPADDAAKERLARLIETLKQYDAL